MGKRYRTGEEWEFWANDDSTKRLGKQKKQENLHYRLKLRTDGPGLVGGKTRTRGF